MPFFLIALPTACSLPGSGGIKQAISGVYGIKNAALTLRQIRNLKNAEA